MKKRLEGVRFMRIKNKFEYDAACFTSRTPKESL